MNRRAFLHLVALFLAGCAVRETPPGAPANTPSPWPTLAPLDPANCRPDPLISPTRPASVPGVYDTDALGLHVAGSPPIVIDPLRYRLAVSGLVEMPLELSLDELRCLPRIGGKVTLTCQGVFRDETSYAGVPLSHLLRRTVPLNNARAVQLVGAESYRWEIDLRTALDENTFLAYQWQNEALPILHGFPLRAVIPTLLGYTWVKQLVELRVV